MKKILIYVLSFFIIMLMFANVSMATNIGVSGDSVTADPGSVVSVKFSTSGISDSNQLGAIEVSIGELPDGITVKSMSSSLGDVTNNTLSWTNGANGYSGNVSISLVLNVSSEVKAGDYNIPLIFDVLTTFDGEDYPKTANATVKVVEKPQETPSQEPTENIPEETNNSNILKSSDAEIKNFSAKANGKDIDININDSRYSTTVDANVSAITFTVQANSDVANIDSDVTTSGVRFKKDSESAGQKTYTVSNLKEGNNVVSIDIIAEDGTTRNYKFVVTRKVADDDNEVVPNIVDNTSKDKDKSKDEEDKDVTELADELDLKSLLVTGVELSPAFNSKTYSYTAIVEGSDSVEIIAVPMVDSASVEVIGNNSLVLGENVITVLVKNDGSVRTYQIVLTKNEPVKIAEVNEEGVVIAGVTFGWKNIAIICVAIIILTLVILFIANMSKKTIEEDYNDNNRSDKDNLTRKDKFDIHEMKLSDEDENPYSFENKKSEMDLKNKFSISDEFRDNYADLEKKIDKEKIDDIYKMHLNFDEQKDKYEQDGNEDKY